MQKTKLKELIISWFGSKTSYNLHKSENPDGLNLVPLDFDGSLQENGWTKLPNGLILQWGIIDTEDSLQTYQFPIAFPHGPFAISVQAVTLSGNTYKNYFGVSSMTRTGFAGQNDNTTNRQSFLVLGV